MWSPTFVLLCLVVSWSAAKPIDGELSAGAYEGEEDAERRVIVFGWPPGPFRTVVGGWPTRTRLTSGPFSVTTEGRSEEEEEEKLARLAEDAGEDEDERQVYVVPRWPFAYPYVVGWPLRTLAVSGPDRVATFGPFFRATSGPFSVSDVLPIPALGR
jgi:hypothetical protein